MTRTPGWLIAIAVVAAPAAAGAGVLGKVVNGLERATGDKPDGQGNAAGGDSKSDTSSGSSASVSDDPWPSRRVTEDPTAPLVYYGPYPTYPNAGPAHIALYLGLHSVEDSDGAAAFSLRTGYGDYGISLSDTSYYERVPGLDGRSDMLRLDVWGITGGYRIAQPGPADTTAIWLHGGLGGAHSSTDVEALGLVLGAEVMHNLSGALGIEASARLFVLQDDIRARELRAGIAASVLRVSYRVLDFNVGPALHGPEVGLAISF
jgi:hypothetical protein